MPYNSKLFVLKIITWNSNCFPRIIISYLNQPECKQSLSNRNNCLKSNNFVFNKNTRCHIVVY